MSITRLRPVLPSTKTRLGAPRKRQGPATTPRRERRRLFHGCAGNPAAPAGARSWSGWCFAPAAPVSPGVGRAHPALRWLAAQRARWDAWSEAAANTWKLRQAAGRAIAPEAVPA